MIQANKPDLTVITNILLSDGIGRQGLGLIQTLYDDLSINVVKCEPILYHGINDGKLLSIINKPLIQYGKISFWTYILGLNNNIISSHQSIKSDIKIAYSMFESDAIPELWTKILNSYYDLLVVPDEYLVKIYQNSGVKIPIFVLPLGIILKDSVFENKSEKYSPFTFGMTGGFWERKNHIQTMKVFNQTFGLNENYKLKIHGRFGSYKNNVLEAYKKLGSPANIEILSNMLSEQDYNKFMNSLDCYVFLSKGEGYSITPREALAYGKPVILSNNTVHQSICKTGYVVPVTSNKKTPAFYEVFGKNIGNQFDIDLGSAASAMKEVVNNYDKYLDKMPEARKWVKQFTWQSLKPRYLSLLSPKKIVLGPNQILEDQLVISDKKLYEKFRKVFP